MVILLINGSGLVGGILLAVQLKWVTKEIGSEMNSVKFHQTQIITESMNMESINDTARFFLEQNSFLILKKTEFISKTICLIAIIIAAQILAISFSSYTYIQANDLQIKQDFNRHPNELLLGKEKGGGGIDDDIVEKNEGKKWNVRGEEKKIKVVGFGEEEKIADLERGGESEEIGGEGIEGRVVKDGVTREGVRDKGLDDQPMYYWKEGGGGCGFYPFGVQLKISQEAQLIRGWAEQIIGFYMVILIVLFIKLRRRKRREEEGGRMSFQVESMPFFKHLKIKNSGRMKEEEDGKEEEKREESEKESK